MLLLWLRATDETAAGLALANHHGDDDAFINGRSYEPDYCPNCENKALVDAGPIGDLHPARWVCYSCGLEWTDGDLETCDYCQEYCDKDDIFAGRCPGCWRDYVARDNT